MVNITHPAGKINPTNSGDALANLGEYLGVDEKGSAKYCPPGYKSPTDYLDYATKLYDADARYDKVNRDWALEDLEFAAGDQWDERVRADRIRRQRPVLTVNVLPQFVGQVVADRRMNKTAIKIRPFRSGTKEVADIRSGLIKSIEMYSRAERAYDAVCEDQVTCGIGNLRVDLEYAANDVFDQDIRIKHIPNPLAVIWDRMSVDPTASDAKHCFVIDSLPKEVFEAKYPDIELPSTGGMGFTDDVMRRTSWVEGELIRVTEFWEMIDKPAVLALLQNGDVVDITAEGSEAQYEGKFFIDPATKKPKIRKSIRTYARMHLITSFAILSECYEIPLTRLPIIRVEGRTIRVGDDRVRFGLVRFAKDAQRLKNYWRSKAAESIALAPQAQWISPEDAVEGLEKEFRDNAQSGDPLLVYKKNASAPPERVLPPAIPQALINEANMNQQDIKDTTGIQDASLGIASNEVSGRAINARKSEGDAATVTYQDNVNQAIQEVGVVCDQMIPIAYDSVRTVRVIGDDDKHNLIEINNVDNPKSINICEGKYDVVLDTGPSFATQRMEALQSMMEILQTSPELMQVIGDLVVDNMDIPGSSEIAARIQRTIPIQLLSADEQVARAKDAQEAKEAEQKLAQDNPEAQQAAQQAQQQQQAVQQAQLQEAQAQLEHAEQMRQVELAEAQAKLMLAQANAKIAESNTLKAQSDAQKAQADAHKAAVEADFTPVKAEMGVQHQQDKHIQSLQQNEDKHIQTSVLGAAQADQNVRHAEESHAQTIKLADQAAEDRRKAAATKPAPGKEKK